MINNYPQVTFVYNRRKTATPTVKAAVELRITYNGKQKYISTGILLYPNQWKKGTIINCPDAIQISQTLDKLISDVRQIILDMINEDNMDISSIQDRLRKKESSSMTLREYFNKRAEVRKYGITPDSQIRYDRFIRFFFKWGKIQDFSDITDANIIAYDKYLKGSGLKRSSIWNCK